MWLAKETSHNLHNLLSPEAGVHPISPIHKPTMLALPSQPPPPAMGVLPHCQHSLY